MGQTGLYGVKPDELDEVNHLTFVARMAIVWCEFYINTVILFLFILFRCLGEGENVQKRMTQMLGKAKIAICFVI